MIIERPANTAGRSRARAVRLSGCGHTPLTLARLCPSVQRMVIAKYRSKCHECGLAIAPGESIEKGYRSFRHAECTMASAIRQTRDKAAAGASQAEIWRWLDAAAHLTFDQKIEALMAVK